MIETYFAPAKRLSESELQAQVEILNENPVINGLLSIVGGLLAVLNENRQILAINENLLKMLGIEHPELTLGMRPGEVLHCVHANEMPGGCGTSAFCSSCGAAIAIVTSLAENRPVEKHCALKIIRDGQEKDIYLSVRSQPAVFDNEQMVLVFLQDITQEQEWAALDRIYYHDTANTLTNLVSASELLYTRVPEMEKKLAGNVHNLAVRLSKDIRIQQNLTRPSVHSYQSTRNEINIQDIFLPLKEAFSHQPIAQGKTISFSSKIPDETFYSDPYLLIRILSNMITNALEASQPGQEIKVWAEHSEEKLLFVVWNQQYIPPKISRRIFQRNFSTKNEMGRGLGTYAMKLFGEEILGGTVDFHTSEKVGTTFFLELPI